MKINQRILVLLYSTLMISTVPTVLADDEAINFLCTFGNSERVIRVEYENVDIKLPCEVIYEKEDSHQALWSAQNIQGFCEIKAREFVEQQRSWGWTCEPIDGPSK